MAGKKSEKDDYVEGAGPFGNKLAKGLRWLYKFTNEKLSELDERYKGGITDAKKEIALIKDEYTGLDKFEKLCEKVGADTAVSDQHSSDIKIIKSEYVKKTEFEEFADSIKKQFSDLCDSIRKAREEIKPEEKELDNLLKELSEYGKK